MPFYYCHWRSSEPFPFYFYFYFYFLAAAMACESSWARGRTQATAATTREIPKPFSEQYFSKYPFLCSLHILQMLKCWDTYY